MADDSRERDPQTIDNAINELAERKNDVGNEKPSTSMPQKRPSPNSSDHQMATKRINKLAGPEKTDDANDENDEINNTKTTGKCTSSTASAATCAKQTGLAGCSQKMELENSLEIVIADHSNNSNSLKTTLLNFKSMRMNANLTSKTFMDEFHTEWLDTKSLAKKTVNCHKQFNSNSVKLYNQPFKICIISDYLEDRAFTQQMVDEMCQMEWHRKQMDLYEFHQTTDLANLPTNAKPALERFYNMLTNDMLPWMKQITGLPLTRISASCSMYNHGDYLLVHDDLLSDRQIAFVFYLSPWCDTWTEQMGGALELFETDPQTGQPKYPIVQKFVPRNNQFIFFRVCKQSFHQVGEVTNLVYPRLTINGWFHGPAPPTSKEKHVDSIISTTNTTEAMDSSLESINAEQYQPPVIDELNLNEWINMYYLQKRVKKDIQQHIESKSEASLEMFLMSGIFDTFVSEFKENTELNWVLEGPANQQKYERLHFAPNSTGALKDLYALFTSESMFGLLHEYTDLDLDGINAQNPTCCVQLCRFTQGCYTLLGDSSTFSDNALDVILFFNTRDGVGKITYLSPTQSANEYNTTAETDVTASSSFDCSGIGNSINESTIIKKASNVKKVLRPPKDDSGDEASSNNSKCMDTSEEEDTIDDSCMSNDSLGTNVNSLTKNKMATEIKLPSSNHSSLRTVRAIVHESNDSDHYEASSINKYPDSDDDDDDDDDDADSEELAQEDALLTIHPKNNSLNIVYRLSGQTKFVKYISKNSLKSDEYIYILFATYKE